MSTKTEETKLTLNLVMVEFIETQAELDDLQGEIEVTRQGRSNHLLQVAQTFKDQDGFLSACKVTEDALTGDGIKVGDKLVKLDKVPRSWIQAKSNIKRAFEYIGTVIPDDKRDLPNKGKPLALNDFTNEYDLRTAVRGIRNPLSEKSNTDQIAEALEFTGDLDEKVSVFLANLHQLAYGEDQTKGLPMALKLMDDSLTSISEMLKEILPVKPEKADQAETGERATA